MDKVWIVLLQVLTGYMPQAFGFLLFVYGFCDQKWNHRYWLGGLLLSALSIIARLLHSQIPCTPGNMALW